MKIKTFYAKTMAEALREIKDKLGPDALLLSTKEIPRRSGIWRNASRFEVVAAVDKSEDLDVFSPGWGHDPARRIPYSSELGQVKTQTGKSLPAVDFAAGVAVSNTPPCETIQEAGRHIADRDDCGNTPVSDKGERESLLNRPVARRFYRELVECGIDAELSRRLLLRAIHELPSAVEPSQPALLRASEKATRSLIAPPSTQNGMPRKKVVAVMGPAGVGKTTSIAKLAAKLALEERKKVVLVSLDGYRIGALEQLRSYARLIGVPFRFVDQVSGLPRVIEESRQKDFILIDTAGKGPRELKSMQCLADFFKQSESIERHLVLSASTKSSDMQRIMDQFEPCAPDHLLFTKLDETTTPGPILNELVRTQKSFSYYTDGQRVPEDLHAVPGRGVMEIILKRNESPLEV